jgi:hypothetical protein
MMIGLVVLTILTVAALVALFRRERKYLKGKIIDTASNELKKYLNVKHAGASFDSELQLSRQKKTKSIDIIKKLNDL